MADEQVDKLKAAVGQDIEKGREIVLPLFAEEMSVSRRVVPKSRVQVSTVTREREQLVDELLASERVEIERNEINRPVDIAPPLREEGDTIIVPIVEEVLTIERRLVLKEEVRIRRIRETQHHQEFVTLRRQEAVITRTRAEDSTAAETADREVIGGEQESS